MKILSVKCASRIRYIKNCVISNLRENEKRTRNNRKFSIEKRRARVEHAYGSTVGAALYMCVCAMYVSFVFISLNILGQNCNRDRLSVYL